MSEQFIETLPVLSVNDMAAEAARRADSVIALENKGASAITLALEVVAAFTAQMLASGNITFGEWCADPESESFKAFITNTVNGLGIRDGMTRDDAPAVKALRKERINVYERASRLFLACYTLATEHSVGPDYKRGTFPAGWYLPKAKDGSDRYEILMGHKKDGTRVYPMVPFKRTKGTSLVMVSDITGEDGKAEAINIKANEAATLRAAFGERKRGKQETTNANAPDVSDASVKASADVLASRLARDGGAVTGDAADALESVYAALVANDATWSLLVALRQKHEREEAAQVTASSEALAS